MRHTCPLATSHDSQLGEDGLCRPPCWPYVGHSCPVFRFYLWYLSIIYVYLSICVIEWTFYLSLEISSKRQCLAWVTTALELKLNNSGMSPDTVWKCFRIAVDHGLKSTYHTTKYLHPKWPKQGDNVLGSVHLSTCPSIHLSVHLYEYN